MAKEQTGVQRRRNAAANGGTGQRLAIPAELRDNAEYEFRFSIDYGSRLSALYENDWDFADIKGNAATHGSESVHKIHTGSNPDGSPQFQYLMRKPREFYKADKAEVQTRINENMNQLKSDAESPSDAARYRPNGATIRLA